MLVRTFEDRDVAHATRLTNHFIRHTAVHFGASPQTEQETAAVWHESRVKYPWLAAEADGAFAGFAKAGVWRARDAYALTTEVTVYVDPVFHRRGVGRALYAELLVRLRGAGFHTAIGGITLPNTGSVALHEAMDFTHVGTFKEVGRKFDRWHDVGFWQVMLK
ncbi:MAG: N-acetyltransferase family protein [Phycisphaerales bacterium]